MNELHVIFGTGPLGRYTAESLLAMGKRVRLLSRSGKMESPPANAELVKADALNLTEIVPLLEGAESVYQCAQPQYHKWSTEFPPLQQAILTASIHCKAKLVAAENLYMYGMPGKEPFTENMPYQPCSKKGKVRTTMTENLFAAYSNGKISVSTVRGSDFFGPWEPINGEMVFMAAIKRKRVNILGSLDQPHSFTYVKDFGKALAIAGTDERAVGKAWHVPSGPALTQKQLLDLLSKSLGYPVKARAAGKFTLGIIGLFNQSLKEVVEMLYEFTNPFILDGSAMEKTFGNIATPMEQRIVETLDWAKTRLKN